MSVIVAEQLTRRYGRRTGVEQLDLRVAEGARFGFLGPNGAGKTTTIRVLLGFLRPTAGRAEVFGLDCWRAGPKIKRDVGYLPGDLLTKVDFVRLLDFHAKQGFNATVAMREYNYQVPYGVLEIDDDYRVKRMVEKPIERRYVSAGIYVLSPDAVAAIPRDVYYDMPTLFNQLMKAGKTVGSFPLRDYWIDIGRMEDLERASSEFTEMFGA